MGSGWASELGVGVGVGGGVEGGGVPGGGGDGERAVGGGGCGEGEGRAVQPDPALQPALPHPPLASRHRGFRQGDLHSQTWVLPELDAGGQFFWKLLNIVCVLASVPTLKYAKNFEITQVGICSSQITLPRVLEDIPLHFASISRGEA